MKKEGITTAVEVSACWAVIETIELIDGTSILLKAPVVSSTWASDVNPVTVKGHSVVVSLVAGVVVAAQGSSSQDTIAAPDPVGISMIASLAVF